MSDDRHSSIGLHQAGSPRADGAIPRSRLTRRARLAAIVLLVLLAVGAAGTVIGRVIHARDLRTTTAAQAVNYVNVAVVGADKGGESLELPGTLQGFIESPIYARTAGYVVRWNADIGARVGKGDVLAEIDTPEVDQQYAEATAAREQAASSLELARTSAERWESLRKRDAVSQQELDERRSAYLQAQANLAAAEANVRRLRDLREFKRVQAPFAGVVTKRNIDVGDLIDPGNGGAARALFTMAQTDPLRVYVYVPQTYANAVHAGQAVEVHQSELSGPALAGVVRRTAGAIDTATRTLQVEINLPNHDGRLLPGSYVQVKLPVGNSGSLVAPSNALMFRADGPRVAIVGPDGHVHLAPVTIGRDFGQTTELLSGIQAGDRIVLNPSDSLTEGDLVSVQAPAPAKEKS
jgi:RND family efflux transporter MFP subunit